MGTASSPSLPALKAHPMCLLLTVSAALVLARGQSLQPHVARLGVGWHAAVCDGKVGGWVDAGRVIERVVEGGVEC